MNRIRQGVVMAEHPYLTPEDLGMERRASDAGRATLDDARARAEIDTIRTALRRCQHNVSEAARELGVSRATLYRLLERYALSGPYKDKATPERPPSPAKPAAKAAVDKQAQLTQPSHPDTH